MEADKRDRITFVAIAVLLVLKFIGRLTPSDELPSPALRTLTLLLDIGLVIGLVGLAPRVLRSLSPDSSPSGWIFLLIVGGAAALGIFAIRLSGGPQLKLAYRNTARTSPTQTPIFTETQLKEFKDLFDSVKRVEAIGKNMPSPPAFSGPPASSPSSSAASEMELLALKTHLLPAVGDYVLARDRLQQTRWVKSPDANAYHPQRITAADLHDAGEKLRLLIASVDKVVADLNASSVPVPATEIEFWRAKREISVLFQQLTNLLEVHWREWHLTGIEPRTGEPKPWQKEAVRLQTEIDKLKENKGESILL